MTLNWNKAKNYLETVEKVYAEIGSVGYFALAFTICPLRDRFNSGERTQKLYDEIMDIKL